MPRRAFSLSAGEERNRPMRHVGVFLAAVLGLSGSSGSLYADVPWALHWGGDVRPLTREACALKAVEAMGVKEKFVFAEVTEDGNARGWNERTAVVVVSFPQVGSGVLVLVYAAGKDDAEAERLRNVVRAHVLDGPYNPDVPQRIGAEESDPKPKGPAIHVHSEKRTVISLLRFFEAAASIVLEKQGYRVGSMT